MPEMYLTTKESSWLGGEIVERKIKRPSTFNPIAWRMLKAGAGTIWRLSMSELRGIAIQAPDLVIGLGLWEPNHSNGKGSEVKKNDSV